MLVRLRSIALGSLLAVAAYAGRASAQEPATEAPGDDPIGDLEESESMPPPGYLPGSREHVGLGLSPHSPEQRSVLPGGVTPAFGAPLAPAEGGHLEFHGYIQAGIRAGIGQRDTVNSGQHQTTFHGDPVVPGAGGYFENTNTVPGPWAELDFSYVTPTVGATIKLGAWNLSESMSSSSYFQPPAQLWVNDAYLTYRPRAFGPLVIDWNVGVYPDRYGAMAQFSEGQYGASIIGSIYGMGETLSARYKLSPEFALQAEHGIKGDFARAPIGILPGGENDYARPYEGSTLVNHAHLGFDWRGIVRPAVHYISAFSQDDLYDDVDDPEYDPDPPKADGQIEIIGADLRLDLRRFGFVYLGGSRMDASHSRSVSNIVTVLNAGSGKDLMERYFGPNSDGSGKLTLVGGQYTVSLGTLLRYPDEFWGEGPDLWVTLFGLYGHVSSVEDAYDDVDKYKLGGELTYGMLSWLAASARFDRAVPNADHTSSSFSVITGKAIFRSDWQTSASLTLQYSRFLYGSDVELKGDNRLQNTLSGTPDEHVLAVYGTMWW